MRNDIEMRLNALAIAALQVGVGIVVGYMIRGL